MTFHQAQAFRDAIEAAAIYHQLQPIFIEKDYWVTYAIADSFKKIRNLLILNQL